MKSVVNLVCIPSMKTVVGTSLFDLVILLLPNLKELLLDLSILILSLSLSPKPSI